MSGIPPSRFRLPDATEVGVVHLQVSDLPRSLDYYQQVLGLRVLHDDAGGAVLAAQHDKRPLVALRSRPGVRPAQQGVFGLYHFALLLPDRAALGRFAANLGSLGVRAGMADHLVSEAFYLADPDALGIEVYADRPRHTWQFRGSELSMTTDPLDLRSVIAAGAGEAWQGAPAGTTVGHVHLHVGRLDAAEAFYHGAIGFDKTVWSYPGALFLAAGGYHHHLGTNVWAPGPSAAPDAARLLEWELVVPSPGDVDAVARSLHDAGFAADEANEGALSRDPWGTELRIRARS